MLAGLTALELFGAFGAAVTIFGGGVTLGQKLCRWSADKDGRSSQDRLNAAEKEAKDLKDVLQGVRSLLDDKTDIWLRSPPDQSKHLSEIRSSIPIITVCNFKGGVGKTTLTSLLAGYFDVHRGKRVLLVDFDYQGSLTDTLIASLDIPDLEASAIRLLQSGREPEDVVAHAYPMQPALRNTRLFSCFYGFNRVENATMMRWIAEGAEARYLTHATLSSKHVQEAFDIVIIDAPPRLSTATVNAFCASTHVLLPTILDSMSTQAALNTLAVVNQFRRTLNPGIEVLGLVPTMVNQIDFNDREREHLERMIARMPEYWPQSPMPHVFRDQRICRREAITKALGHQLAFSSSDEVKRMAIALGEALEERLFVNEGEGSREAPAGVGNVSSIGNGRRRA